MSKPAATAERASSLMPARQKAGIRVTNPKEDPQRSSSIPVLAHETASLEASSPGCPGAQP